MSGVKVAVVWEWLGDNGTSYIPYSSEVVAELEHAKNSQQQWVYLGQIDAFLEPYTVDTIAMQQTSAWRGRQRPVRRVVIDQGHSFVSGTRWEWDFGRGTFFPYGAEENRVIEQQRRSAGSGRFQLPGTSYCIDLNALQQINTQTNYARTIRQVQCTPYNTPQGYSRPPAYSNSPAQAQPAAQPPPYLPPHRRQQAPAVANPAQTTSSANWRQPAAAANPILPAANPTQPAAAANAAGASANSGQAQSTAAAQPLAGPAQVPAAAAAGSSARNPLSAIINANSQPYVGDSGVAATCPVCQNCMSGASDYTDLLPGISAPKLTLSCGHHLHNACLAAMVSASSETASFRCPECQKSFGTRIGDQPATGRMAVRLDTGMTLAGHGNNAVIVVTYSFNSGVTAGGVPYTANGFPRTAYFPDTAEGNEIVDLIKLAFKRRLVFTIGTSVTTGQQNTLVWNDIHHKTSLARGDTYGYPDPGYLQRVRDELKAKGVE